MKKKTLWFMLINVNKSEVKMKNLDKNSKTKENLLKAFAGESMARNRYTFYSKIAKKEGFEQIAGFFLETAENEKEHAKIFYDFLGEQADTMEIKDAKYGIGISNSTLTNLQNAASGEHEENSFLYPSFSKIAKEEGYNEISSAFSNVVKVEIEHEKRYLELINNILDGKVFKKEEEVIWKCRKCGYHHIGKKAPDICPVCKHPIGYFELFVKNY